MQKTLLILAVLSGGIWLQLAPTAVAQNQNLYNTYNMAYARPAVSPYLNLGINANGLSNYQTLVRPMIDDRDAIQQESNSLQQLRQQLRGGQNGQASRDPRQRNSDRPQEAKRYMNYSHYFGYLGGSR